MPHRKDRDEEWVIALLEQIVQLDRENRDAISGQAMRHIKRALIILKKRRNDIRPPLPRAKGSPDASSR
jgi:hypothetical protein